MILYRADLRGLTPRDIDRAGLRPTNYLIVREDILIHGIWGSSPCYGAILGNRILWAPGMDGNQDSSVIVLRGNAIQVTHNDVKVAFNRR